MANQLKTLIAEAEAIRTGAEAKGKWSEEDAKAFEAKLGEIDRAKLAIELSGKLDEVKSWAHGSEGAAVLTGFRSAGPEEGTIPGVDVERQIIGYTKEGHAILGAESGVMFGYSALGEEKIRTFKSGAYKDAVNTYIRTAALNGSNWPSAMKASHMKVLQEGQDTAGGFWVPIDQRAEVVKKMGTITGVRDNVYRFTTGSDLVTFPKIVYETGPSDDTLSSLYPTGIRPANGPEAPTSDIAESTNPVAGKIMIPVHLQTAAIVLTRQLVEDSMFDVMGYVSQIIGEVFALQEDVWFCTGTGSGQPQGLTLHANATVASTSNKGMYVPTGSSAAVAWGTGATSGLLFAEAALPPQYDNGAKWYATKKTYAAIRGINVTTAGIQWGLGEMYPNASNGYAPTLLGHPIVKDQFVAELAANSLSMYFGDMSGYYVPERVGLSVEVFREIKGLRDEIVLYARRRLGGQLVHDWKVKLVKASVS